MFCNFQKIKTMTAQQYLKKYFGYDEFRGLQQQIITQVTAGKDALVLMPTGGGKSVCYQIPALMLEGITIVVSPLISLMKDQVDALRSNGIQAAFLNSSLNYQQEQEIAALCLHNQLKLLYLSPEKALALADNFLRKLNVSLIAIDEAHCVSQWGHDFRPEYKEISKLRDLFPNVPLMALTATADKITRQDILTLLGLKEPELFVSSFDRPNLSLTVRAGWKKKEKLRDITTYLQQHPNDCGIIYCTSRKSVESLTFDLLQAGFKVKGYHAGMDSEQRTKVQEAFINDDVQVVCATIAFGMGIDKSNVRFVMHYNLPKSIESYYQEIGRGGRDGLPCTTVLYYTLGDLMMLREFATNSGQPEINLEKLKRMQEFAEARHCRRRILLSYFGQQHTENCGNCDVCLHPPNLFNGTVVAQKALSALYRINATAQQVGVNLLIDVLRGMRHKEIFERKLEQIKTYGAGADFSFKEWSNYLMQMIQLGAMEIAYNEGHVLRLTDFGELILKGKFELQLHQFAEETFVPAGRSKSSLAEQGQSSGDSYQDIFEALRKLRKQLAEEHNLPPYIIFHDTSLKAMAEQLPQTEQEMLNISGVSFSKMQEYGHRFLEITQQFSPLTTATVDVEEVLSEEKLQAYYEELQAANLRFSTAVVGYLLIGSDRKGYAEIARSVSFGGLLRNRLTYEEVKQRIKPFYEKIENDLKRKKQEERFDQDEQLVHAQTYFAAEEIDLLSAAEWEKMRASIDAIPLQKTGEGVSEALREIRKAHRRANEPWCDMEVSLLKNALRKTNKLQALIDTFGRSERSIMVYSAKLI